MDSGDAIVLVLIFFGVVFLIFVERNSRQNEAKLKAEAAAKAGAAHPHSAAPAAQDKGQETSKSSKTSV